MSTQPINRFKDICSSKSAKVFAVLFVLFALQGLGWTLGTPLLGASDEPAHIVTAAADARGQLIKKSTADKSSPVTAVNVPLTFAETQSESYCYSLASEPASCLLTKAQCKTQSVASSLPCGLSLNGSKKVVDTGTYTGNYPPLYYIITGLPSLISSRPTIIYLMRLTSVVLSVFFIALTFVSLFKWSSDTLLLAGTSLALSPIVMYLVSVVNPSGLEISTALCLWVTGLLIVRGSSRFKTTPRPLLTAAFISAAVLVLSRPDGPLWGVITMLVLAFISKASVRRELSKSKLFYYLSGAWIVCLLVAVAWIVLEHGSLVLAGQTYPYGTSVVFISQSVLANTRIFIEEMIGLLGWNNVPVLFLTIFIWYIAFGSLLVLAISSLTKRTWREVFGLISIVLAVLLIPVIYTIIYAHRYGNILQGRYMLPAEVGAIVLAAKLAQETVKNPIALAKTIIVLVTVGNMAAYCAALRQYTVGLTRLDLFGHQPGNWSPPVPVAVLIIGFTLASSLTALYLWKMADQMNHSTIASS